MGSNPSWVNKIFRSLVHLTYFLEVLLVGYKVDREVLNDKMQD